MPHEGANNIAYALFSFPSLADYEAYRIKILTDPDCLMAWRHAETTRCILSFERSFLRPVFDVWHRIICWAIPTLTSHITRSTLR